MLVFQQILGFVILLGGLVAVHELGHFGVAKLLGVKVLKFSIGFGPKLWGFKYGETEYVLAWIPLGGFVRMAGELPKDAIENPEEEARSFLAQPWWKRAAIALAGPAFNIVFPVLVFFVVYWGSTEVFLPRLGAITPGFPAAQAGLLPGDVLTRIDGVPIQSFEDISTVLRNRWEKEVAIEYKRDGVIHSTQLRPMRHEEVTPLGKRTQGILGVSLQARPAVLGVLPGSAAQAAGLKTFDRVLEINGEPIRDEVELLKALKVASSPLQLRVARAQYEELAGWKLQMPEVVLLSMPKQEGLGYEAMGAMPGDLFVAEVLANSPAEKAGLKQGDFLLTWNGEPIHSWSAIAQKLKGLEGQPIQLRWLSPEGKHEEKTLAQEQKEIQIEFKHRLQVWELGLRPQLAYVSTADTLRSAASPETQIIHIGFWQAWGKALKVVPDITLQMAASIAKLLTGKVSGENVGGPVLIFQTTAQGIEQGLDGYLRVMALISISLALANLLPVPVLDGFTVLSALWEGIRRKPLPMRFREIANLVGFVLLMLMMGYAFKNDIVRLLR
ncbi:MAG: RIP metalloprotease RseP [Cystobacterineae bacterium]|nr:RIP metalloprotease RseP [Cystobacterineae bacterium]